MPTGTRLRCYTSRPSVLFIYILYPLERSPIETTEQPAPSPLRGGGSTTTKKGSGGPLRWRGGVRCAPPAASPTSDSNQNELIQNPVRGHGRPYPSQPSLVRHDRRSTQMLGSEGGSRRLSPRVTVCYAAQRYLHPLLRSGVAWAAGSTAGRIVGVPTPRFLLLL